MTLPKQIREIWLWLGAVMCASFGLRVFVSRQRVLLPDHVNFQGVDAWYHVRLIENLVHNFPHWLTVDPYALGSGQRVAVAPFFNLVVAAVAWVAGLGAPSAHTIHLVAALTPPVLAALETVPVYLIGAHVFGRRAGLLAAALLAIMPGPFLDRTMFGYVDHHAMEVLLASLVIWAVMTRQRRGVLAGVALGCYLLTWTSGIFLVAVLGLWLLQSLLDYLRARPIEIRFVDMLVTAGIALVLVVLMQDHEMFRFGSQVAAVSALAALSAIMEFLRRQWPPSPRTRWLVPGAAAAVAVGAFAVFVFAMPSVSGVILGDLSRFKPGIAGQTVNEAIPLFYVLGGGFSLAAGYVLFRTAFFLGATAMVPLTRRVWRQRNPSDTLLWTWAAVTFVATLSQNRFGYYLQMNLALLSGWLCDAALSWAIAPRVKVKVKGKAQAAPGRWRPAIVWIAILIVLFVPGAIQAFRVAEVESGVPAPWYEAMQWLRANSPEPFGAPERYLASVQRTGADNIPAYTIMNWWDFGYRITAIAHRVPVSNPTQEGSEQAARFFTATSEADANAIMDEAHALYVVADESLPLTLDSDAGGMTGSLVSMARWAHVPVEKFYDVFFQADSQGRLSGLVLFYPEYYQTMAYRLFVNGGQAYAPKDSTYVITYVERRFADGRAYKLITGSQRFGSFEEGRDYAAVPGQGMRRVVSRDPRVSPTRLEPLSKYTAVYESLPTVRIFRHTR